MKLPGVDTMKTSWDLSFPSFAVVKCAYLYADVYMLVGVSVRPCVHACGCVFLFRCYSKPHYQFRVFNRGKVTLIVNMNLKCTPKTSLKTN